MHRITLLMLVIITHCPSVVASMHHSQTPKDTIPKMRKVKDWYQVKQFAGKMVAVANNKAAFSGIMPMNYKPDMDQMDRKILYGYISAHAKEHLCVTGSMDGIGMIMRPQRFNLTSYTFVPVVHKKASEFSNLKLSNFLIRATYDKDTEDYLEMREITAQESQKIYTALQKHKALLHVEKLGEPSVTVTFPRLKKRPHITFGADEESLKETQ